MKYYVTIETHESGDHTLHRADCPKLPEIKDLQYLGDFIFCHSAMAEAGRYFKQINGCEECTRAYHSKEE